LAFVSAIDRLLSDARASLVRVDAPAAAEAMRRGALLVDTRPVELRRRDGEIPGALVIDRNVLEWRLDPTSPQRTAELTGAEQPVIVVCNQGYASSLAAATLRQLGLVNATDLVGGFEAWAAAGLPVQPMGRDGDGHTGPGGVA
jgi:rhodanese-related sulfurtransferase